MPAAATTTTAGGGGGGTVGEGAREDGCDDGTELGCEDASEETAESAARMRSLSLPRTLLGSPGASLGDPEGAAWEGGSGGARARGCCQRAHAFASSREALSGADRRDLHRYAAKTTMRERQFTERRGP